MISTTPGGRVAHARVEIFLPVRAGVPGVHQDLAVEAPAERVRHAAANAPRPDDSDALVSETARFVLGSA